MKKTKEEYKELMVFNNEDFSVTFKDTVLVSYEDKYSQYKVIIEKIKCFDMTFKAITVSEMNYKHSSLNFFRISDNELISAFREKYPVFCSCL